MARYVAQLGCRVEVLYRAGDIILPAVGKLVGDSGRSIFLEEQIQQHGKEKTFRWEIPYQSIIRLAPSPAPAPLEADEPRPQQVSTVDSSASLGVAPLKSRPDEV